MDILDQMCQCEHVLIYSYMHGYFSFSYTNTASRKEKSDIEKVKERERGCVSCVSVFDKVDGGLAAA